MSTIPEDRQVRPFADFLVEQEALAEQCSEALNLLVEAVADTGKAGTLTLQVKAKPIGTQTGQVVVAAEVKTNLPQPDPQARIYFVTDDFNLSRSDPHQRELPLREVPRPEQTARDIHQERPAR